VRTHWAATIVAACFIALAFSLFAREPKPSVNANAYPHGMTTCLEGAKGPGLQLFLKQDSRCETGKPSHSYLEVDIREQPISVHKSISIGADNWAFRCANPKESCKQALSGYVWFDHFEDASGKGIQTDGYYELRFSTGESESGPFKVDCIAPCG
jgi:hypothetical protein